MTLADDRHRYMSLAQVLQLSVRKQVRAETMFTEVDAGWYARFCARCLAYQRCAPGLRASFASALTTGLAA